MVLGAILAFAVQTDVPGINVNSLGVINSPVPNRPLLTVQVEHVEPPPGGQRRHHAPTTFSSTAARRCQQVARVQPGGSIRVMLRTPLPRRASRRGRRRPVACWRAVASGRRDLLHAALGDLHGLAVERAGQLAGRGPDPRVGRYRRSGASLRLLVGLGYSR
jgi:hypothetical protein